MNPELRDQLERAIWQFDIVASLDDVVAALDAIEPILEPYLENESFVSVHWMHRAETAEAELSEVRDRCNALAGQWQRDWDAMTLRVEAAEAKVSRLTYWHDTDCPYTQLGHDRGSCTFLAALENK